MESDIANVKQSRADLQIEYDRVSAQLKLSIEQFNRLNTQNETIRYMIFNRNYSIDHFVDFQWKNPINYGKINN
jgi:hypothetical protein